MVLVLSANGLNGSGYAPVRSLTGSAQWVYLAVNGSTSITWPITATLLSAVSVDGGGGTVVVGVDVEKGVAHSNSLVGANIIGLFK